MPFMSPMALNSPSPSQSMLKKKSYNSASSYLSAVSEADTRARRLEQTPDSTPDLSASSSVSVSSKDTLLDEGDEFDNSDGLKHPREPPGSDQVFTTVHTEFGYCTNEAYRFTSEHNYDQPLKSQFADPPYYILVSVYLTFLLLICIGHMRDFFGKRFRPSVYKHLMAHNGFAPLNSDFDSFYTRRFKRRIDDCFSQPVTGVAGRTMVILNRTTDNYNVTQTLTGGRTRALNVSSYNYLGFAQAQGGCADVVEASLRRYGVCAGGARLDGGTSDFHVQSEALVAKFVGTEDALISSMGFATNSTFIPALVGKGCLVISDELNHASIRIGVRFSGADVRTFGHNDMKSLESLLRDVISQGQPKTHRQWKKIMVIVEGLYSMEGTLVNLPAIMDLKKKYKFFLFVDEAHSIGAIGPHGRGVCDYFNIPPRSVDVLMGTFTKSFGAAGGYIAGSKVLIDRLRIRGHSGTYAEAMAPSVLAQLVASMASIMGVADSGSPGKTSNPSNSSVTLLTPDVSREPYQPGPAPVTSLPVWMDLPAALRDGTEGRSRLRRLAFNSRYLHRGLVKLGFITYGHPSSPIVPLLVFNLGKLPLFHRMMKDRTTPIIIVAVGYPATSLVSGRVRFCLSAAHTKEDVDLVLKACDEIGDILDLKHGQGERWPLEDILSRSMELVNQ